MAEQDTHDQIALRKKRALEWREEGVDPYPVASEQPAHLAQALHEQYGQSTNEEFEARPVAVSIAGRLVLNRLFGKAAFAHVQDRSGRIQVFFEKKSLAEEFARYKKLDVGDIIFVAGTLFRTKTDELTIRVERFSLYTKCVHPLPEKWHGLSDVEKRYRQRYVDLIVNQDARKTFALRSKITTWIREYFVERDFLEVETPMMHTLVSGAAAKPFVTHHNTLGMDLYMRIAPETYLKRLVVGGFERVFEIGRNFRNEGISTQHNPEFTMLEFYWAYATYGDLMDLTEDLIRELTRKVTGGETKIAYQGVELDFGAPFRRVSMREAVSDIPGYAEECLTNVERFASLFEHAEEPPSQALRHKFFDPEKPLANLVTLFEELVEPKLMQPTFITGFPAIVSPLARRTDGNADYTDRFELYIYGRELANGFNELADPVDQEGRFRAQVEQKEAGDEEAMDYDADYIRALEYGLPPTAGEGIGIDRLVMLLTDAASIRDVILFPQMRARAAAGEGENSQGEGE